MKPQREPQQLDIDWTGGGEPGGGDPGTVDQATLVLMGAVMASGDPQSLTHLQEGLTQLHEQEHAPDTPAGQVPPEVWGEILGQLTPQDLAAVAQVSKLFHKLVRQGKIPIADSNNPNIVHVYNIAQLEYAVEKGRARFIVVHAGIAGGQVADAAAAAGESKELVLGPEVTVPTVTGGQVEVEKGGEVTTVTGGTVTVRNGGMVTTVTGGLVGVWPEGVVTTVTGGTVEVWPGATVTVGAGIELIVDDAGGMTADGTLVIRGNFGVRGFIILAADGTQLYPHQ